MRGGKRAGAGRKPGPTGEAMVQLAARLPQWLADWVRDQPRSISDTIRRALTMMQKGEK